MHALHPFFHPRSLAIIGASSDPERIGGRPLRFLIEAGFAGELHPVNISGHAELQGRKAWRSVLDIPGPVDHAIVAVPVAGVEQAVLDCAAKGVPAVQVFTAGFAEAGPEGAALQRRLVEIARGSGMRIVGPNALGLIRPAGGLFATFSTLLNGVRPRAGRIGLATQSGAFGSASYGAATLRHMGLSCAIATGNESDVDVAECIEYLAEDPETFVICAALEACRDGQALRRALLKAADAGKPVVIMKIGTSEVGAAAAATHTGSLAGDDAVYDAVFAECGAWRVRSIEDMLDLAYLCDVNGGLPRGPRLGIVTGSGGIGVLMADTATEAPAGSALQLPALPLAAADALRAVLPFATAANPYDTTAQVTSVPQGIPRVIEVMLAQSGFDAVFAYLAHSGLSPARFAASEQALGEIRARYPQQLLGLAMLSESAVDQRLSAAGVPVFADPSRAMRALCGAWGMASRRQALHRVAAPQPSTEALPDVATEAQAKAVLAAAGLPMLPEHACADADSAVAAAVAVGFPVVAKILSPDIAHKTEVGGVMLGLADGQAVAAAFHELMRRAATARPDARLEGVLIAPMLRGGVETIAGVIVDPVFGPMVMFGLGGTAVELYRDVAFASAPLTEARAEALVRSVRANVMLDGWRGAPPSDRAALVRALVSLSEFAAAHAHAIAGIDINPLVVRADGCVCLDALITPAAQPAPTSAAT